MWLLGKQPQVAEGRVGVGGHVHRQGFVGAGTALAGHQLEMLGTTLSLNPRLLPWILSKLSKAVFTVQTEACHLDVSIEFFCSVSLWMHGTRHTLPSTPQEPLPEAPGCGLSSSLSPALLVQSDLL